MQTIHMTCPIIFSEVISMLSDTILLGALKVKINPIPVKPMASVRKKSYYKLVTLPRK